MTWLGGDVARGKYKKRKGEASWIGSIVSVGLNFAGLHRLSLLSNNLIACYAIRISGFLQGDDSSCSIL